MTHPHQLHARRALWDLYDLWPQLVQAERAEHARLSRAAYGNATHDGVRSTATGTRSVGTHSDPVAGAVLAGVDERPNRYAVLRGRQLETLTWLERRVAGTNMQIIGPCTGFFAVLQKLTPLVAADLARWIDEISTRVREALEAAPATIVVTGASCPACGVRLLYGHVSGPRDAWDDHLPTRLRVCGRGLRVRHGPADRRRRPHLARWTVARPPRPSPRQDRSSMSDIVGFITARLDEDEAVARAANPGPWRRFTDKPHLSPHAIFGGRWPGDMVKLRNVCTIDISWQPAENADHITRHNPARVLADIAAKRAIIAAYLRTDADDPEDCFAHYALEDALRELAAVHGDHPDYDPSWRPA